LRDRYRRRGLRLDDPSRCIVPQRLNERLGFRFIGRSRYRFRLAGFGYLGLNIHLLESCDLRLVKHHFG
jgi:hypothetical protein